MPPTNQNPAVYGGSIKRRTLETEQGGGIPRNGDAPRGDQAGEVAPRKLPVKHEEKKRPRASNPLLPVSL